jgi:hypothetical protein
MSTNISDLPISPPNPQPLVQNQQVSNAPSQQYYIPPSKMELPPRDIPQHTTTHTIDPTTIPNYLPPQGQPYISDSQYTNPPTNPIHYQISDEFKIPILLFILYYLFQLPIVNTIILRIFPDMLNASGHLTSSGTIVKSLLFGIFYYLFIKGLIYFS